MAQIIENVAHRVGMKTAEDLFDTIGYGGIPMSRIAVRLRDECEKMLKVQETEQQNADEAVLADVQEKGARRAANVKGGGVIVDGAAGCLVKFAKCCNPLPGDPVIGFVTRGFGISVHKRDCPNAVAGVADASQADRWLSAHWEKEKRDSVYEAALSILAEDKIGVLAEISAALADMRVPVMTINVAPPKNARAVINLTVGCRDTEHYHSIVSRLNAIETIISVVRGADGKAFS